MRRLSHLLPAEQQEKKSPQSSPPLRQDTLKIFLGPGLQIRTVRHANHDLVRGLGRRINRVPQQVRAETVQSGNDSRNIRTGRSCASCGFSLSSVLHPPAVSRAVNFRYITRRAQGATFIFSQRERRIRRVANVQGEPTKRGRNMGRISSTQGSGSQGQETGRWSAPTVQVAKEWALGDAEEGRRVHRQVVASDNVSRAFERSREAEKILVFDGGCDMSSCMSWYDGNCPASSTGQKASM